MFNCYVVINGFGTLREQMQQSTTEQIAVEEAKPRKKRTVVQTYLFFNNTAECCEII